MYIKFKILNHGNRCKSIISLVVKYLPSKQMSWVRFPDDALFVLVTITFNSRSFLLLEDSQDENFKTYIELIIA